MTEFDERMHATGKSLHIFSDSAAQASSPYVVRMIPLLVEGARGRKPSERVLVVDCPEALQVARVVARSNLAPAEVKSIMATQATREQRLALADDVIDNSGTPEALNPQVDTLHRRYLEMASRRRED